MNAIIEVMASFSRLTNDVCYSKRTVHTCTMNAEHHYYNMIQVGLKQLVTKYPFVVYKQSSDCIHRTVFRLGETHLCSLLLTIIGIRHLLQKTKRFGQLSKCVSICSSAHTM